jgi:hypothetical protein
MSSYQIKQCTCVLYNESELSSAFSRICQIPNLVIKYTSRVLEFPEMRSLLRVKLNSWRELSSFSSSLMCPLQDLELYNCSFITILPCFPFLRRIKINRCYEISSVEPLKEVPSICLIACHGIGDVSFLRKNSKTEIIDCNSINPYSSGFFQFQ